MVFSSAKSAGKIKKTEEILMFTRISQKLTNRLLYKGIIDKDSYEIYQYGMEQFIISILNMLTLMILGILFGMLWNGLLFVIAFLFLRKYAGGYHASTPLRYYLMTIGVITATLSVMKYVELDIFVCVELLTMSSGIILLLSPVESENKPLDGIEKLIYRKKTIIIWCVEILCFVLLQIINLRNLSISIICAQIVTSLSLVKGKLKMQSIRRNNKNEKINLKEK